MDSYGSRVRAARDNKGWSQARLARELGFEHPVAVHRLETDAIKLTPALLHRIHDVLGVRPEDFVDTRYEAECQEYGVEPKWKR